MKLSADFPLHASDQPLTTEQIQYVAGRFYRLTLIDGLSEYQREQHAKYFVKFEEALKKLCRATGTIDPENWRELLEHNQDLFLQNLEPQNFLRFALDMLYRR